MNMLKQCNFCQQPADLMCSRCLEVYCTVECQIRDWSEHKRICISIPKLYPNDSYVDLLSGGLAPPRKGAIFADQSSLRILANNSRSLKPLRKPNVPLGTIEISVNRENTFKPVEKAVEAKTTSPTKTTTNIQITAPSASNEKRSSQVKIEEVSESSTVPEKPQSLAKLKLEVLKNHQSNKKKNDAAKPDESDRNQQRKPWLFPFPVDKKNGEPFDVIVQCRVPDQQNAFWVIQATHETQCDKLLRDIHSQLNTKAVQFIEYDKIQVDDIFAAPFEDIYYRVVILEKVDPAKHLLRVRLIDYGNEITIPASDLREPLLLMKNLRAFAFQIEIANLNRKLELCENLCIRVVQNNQDRMIVEMANRPVTYLLDIVGRSENKSGAGGIITILTPKTLLIMLTCSHVKPIMKELYTQLPEAAVSFTAVSAPKVGDVICVNAPGVGWSRGLIISTHATNFLIYTVDNGTIELISKDEMIRTLPEDYKRKPKLVLQMDIERILMNEEEFKNKFFMPSIAFSYDNLGYDEEKRVMKGMIKDTEGIKLLAEALFREFDFDLQKMGIRYWQVIPQDKCIVRITSVIDVSTVIICPHDKINMFTELLQSMLPDLTQLKTKPAPNDIVIGMDDIMMPYRARVLKVDPQGELQLLDLDNGNIKKIHNGTFYAPNQFVSHLPVHTMKIKIRDLNPTLVRDASNAVDFLNNLRSDQRKLRLLFEGSSFASGVKLIDTTTNRTIVSSLMEELEKKQQEVPESKVSIADKPNPEKERITETKPQTVEAGQTNTKEVQKVTETKQATSQPDKFMLDDLPLIKLTTDRNDVKLTILDDGDLKHGILTVTEITPENVRFYETVTVKVNTLAAKIGGDCYNPEPNELCVAVFDEDKLWYRAVCLQQADDRSTFVVQFIDFGNVCPVKPSNIRRLSKELLFPCAAHLCKLDDADKSLAVLIEQQRTLGHVVPKLIQADGDIYTLKF
ncbi:uncharacterized protein LOC129747072 [Uranotaenia lowii]|uniref:uncharacterized protein LOC129747072 n=1 Tax=Uranotaenia lowii TaxID=190385 RepID=UPI002478606D|nr:uncharacterized protein LOC129747072 [Uranotaenia lowii]